MALLKFKRSAVPAKVPALNDLALGELAINTYDGKVYTKKDNGTASIVEVGGGGGVTSFNTRTGAVTLSGSDVTTALGYTPANKAGDTFTGGVYSAGQIRAAGWWGDVSASATGLGVEIGESGGRSYVISYSRDVAAYGPMSFEATDFTFTGVSGGFIGANTSVRAPIFYDSNNTGYFLDPAGSSNLLSVQINGTLDVRDSNAQFWRSTNGAYQRVDTRTDATSFSRAHWYGVSSSGGTSNFRHAWYDNAAYFYVTAQDGEIIFNREAGETIVRSTGSFRAPIFYDSNDTAFFLDPNSTSVLSKVRANAIQHVNGTDAIALTDGSYLYFRSPDNGIRLYLGGADPANYYDNDAHNFRNRSGGQYATIAASGMYASTFYDYANTAYYVDPASGSQLNIVSLNAGSKLHLVSLTDGNHYLRYAATGFSGAVIDGAQLAGHQGGELATNLGGDNWSLRWDASGNTFSRASSRAPIFYDSNDTGYYLDAASTSRINQINYTALYSASSSDYGIVGNNGYFDTVNSGVDADALELCYVRGSEVRIGTGGGNKAIRASIFYEGTDTAYFVDPNGGTSLRTVGDWRSDSGAWTGEFNGKIQYHANNWYFQGANTWEFRRSDSANAFSVSQAGVAEARNDFRAPIFYDNYNTGYYVDPNGTSNLAGLTVANRITGSVTGCTFTQDSQDQDNIANRTDSGFYQSSSGTTAEGWPINDGNWQHMIACTHTNDGNYFAMQLGASFFSQGLFYRSVANSGTQAWSRVALYDNGYAAPLYASIYYDADNTGYYVDPFGTSITNVMRGDKYHSLYNGGQPAPRWDNSFYVLQSQHWYSHNGTSTMYVGESGDFVYIRGYTTADGSSRAPIFYDNQNTGYYVDPSSTGTSLNVAGNIDCYARSAAWAEGVRVRVPSRATWGGIRFTRDEANSNGNWAIGFTGIDSTDDLTFWGNLSGSEGMRARLTQAGDFTATGNVTAYSDARLKENVETIANALELVGQMRGVTYNRKDSGKAGVGVIAQEMREIMPEVVVQDGSEDGTLSVAYGNLVGVLIEAVKELALKVKTLEEKDN